VRFGAALALDIASGVGYQTLRLSCMLRIEIPARPAALLTQHPTPGAISKMKKKHKSASGPAQSCPFGVPSKRGEFGDYLLSGAVTNADDDAVRRLYAEIAPRGSVSQRAEQLFTWVRDRVAHSSDANRTEVPCSASEVVQQLHGLCFAKSHLLVALLRASCIPSGLGYQKLRRDGPDSKFVLHGFVYFLDDKSQRFVPVDPRGNNARVSTSFSINAPALAFQSKAAWGEQTYDTVFAHPLEAVVEVLTSSVTLEEALRRLPGEVLGPTEP
jgi:transglutaminase-like putative cysteine protease